MSAFKDELDTIRKLRKMGATHVKLPLLEVTFPEGPVDPQPKRLVIPKKLERALAPLLEDPSDPREQERHEMDALLRDTVG